MDTSKEYIAMVDCPEIQGQKEKFIDGDWFAYYDPMAHGKRGELCVIIVGSAYYTFTREYVKKWHHLSVVGYDEGDCELVWEDKIIYLPRQDQIQKMMPQCNCSICLIEGLHEFTTDNIDGFFELNFESMEQIWLAFYMCKKHKKIWDGEKWIKS